MRLAAAVQLICVATFVLGGCGGSRKRMSLLEIGPEPPGTQCALGGQALRAGLDDNGDGVLGEAEVDSLTFVCTAGDGQLTSARALSDEAEELSGRQGPRGPRGRRGPPGPPGPP